MQVDSQQPAMPGPGQSPPPTPLPLPLPRSQSRLIVAALDDLFADEQLASLLPKMENPTEESMGDLSNPMVMRTYYSRLLPWKPMFLWLNQSHGACPSRPFRARTVTLLTPVTARPQCRPASSPTASSPSPSRTTPTSATSRSTRTTSSGKRSSGSTRAVSRSGRCTRAGCVSEIVSLFSDSLLILRANARHTAQGPQGVDEVGFPSLDARARL